LTACAASCVDDAPAGVITNAAAKPIAANTTASLISDANHATRGLDRQGENDAQRIEAAGTDLG
jgi:fructose-1,6-bisphosphatase/sedoheptulose 1,7-bisphosphatase-like protein